MYAATILALHRLVASVSSRLCVRMTTNTAVVWMIVPPWMIGLMNNLMPAVGRTGYRLVFNQLSGRCIFALSGRDASFALAYTVVGIYIPTAVMSLSYGMFLLKTCRSSGLKRSNRIRRRRLELSRTMLILFVWHCVSLYPASIALGLFPHTYLTSLELQLICKFLGNSCSATNPIFCWCSSKLFEEGTKAVFCKIRRLGSCQKRSAKVTPPSTAPATSAGAPTGRPGSPNNGGMVLALSRY
ncbi:hypothetical protein BV898_03050 [Hypsibius exemplaris]|uniref:G-protein coupled receptors family 1 profile domain-containing protein n=1 Tax=Hypsibius exemplaris TaxID=2072580 RepID=A0A1W0X658_HYPEX|nr:hypothetical protein BV898_03050 [Hypsibius exemplaris]